MLIPVIPSMQAVAKLALDSPDAAHELVRLALYETLCDLIDTDGAALAGTVTKSLQRRDAQLRRELVRTYIDKRAAGEPIDGVLAAAQEISKATQRFKELEHKRDPYTGRWVVMIPEGTPISDTHALAAKQIEAWRRRGVITGESEIHVVGTQEGSGRPDMYRKKITIGNADGEAAINSHLHTTGLQPRRLELHPRETSAPMAGNQQQVHDVLAAVTRSPAASQKWANALPSDQSSFTSALENVVNPNKKNRLAYRRIGATGRALNFVSPPGSTTFAIGSLAQVAGDLGPEAERILGPGIRRTAYRYRGTEKTPDYQLVTEMEKVNTMLGLNPQQLLERFTNSGTGSRGASPATLRPDVAGLAPGSLAFNARPDWHPDQRALATRGDTAVGYYIPRIPDLERAELSIKSGRVPPSQGVIIDEYGDVVSEAMGAGSDHYLPFDLKNLKSLHGGQYVRTRVAGGPTTEDIYTGLLTGARQLQVASNSGVFTVEFDPSLRGTRRYSDKAHLMVKRYQAILDRIWASQEGGTNAYYTSDIPASEKHAITQRAYADANYNEKTAQDLIATRLNEARQAARLAGPDDELLAEQARDFVDKNPVNSRLSGQQRAGAIEDAFHQLRRENEEGRVNVLQLDGEGYHRALQSLQEEFPYFIRRVSYEPMEQFVADRRHGTPGVKPRRGAPRKPDSGFVGAGRIHAVNTGTDHTLHADREREPAVPAASGGAAVPALLQGSGSGASTPGAGDAGDGLPNITLEPSADSDSTSIFFNLKNSFAILDDPISDPIHFNEEVSSDKAAAEAEADRVLRSDPTGVKTIWWLRNYKAAAGDSWPAAAQKLIDSGTPEQIEMASRAMKSLRHQGEKLWNDGHIAEDHGKGSQWDPDQLRAIEEAEDELVKLRRAKGALLTKAPEGKDPVTHVPDGNVPVHFDKIANLKTNPVNYTNFLGKTSKPFQDAVAMLAPMTPEQRKEHVSSRALAYQRAVNWATSKNPVKPAGELPNGINSPVRAQEMVNGGKNSIPYRDLRTAQQAWAFVHMRDSLPGGGATVPKAQAATAPAFSSVSARHPLAKRRVIVHPPGSPLAKAFAKARATRT